MPERHLDRWAAWLLTRRDGGDPEQRALAMEHLIPIRERVLDQAQLMPGDRVLDVGGGDGPIAFGATDRIGETGSVILSDISRDLVTYSRDLAEELGVAERMSFVEADAESLEMIDAGSVDVVTTRSVLIYVADKAKAFTEFHRVLRPGGRLSIFEPINNYFSDDDTEFWGLDARPVRDLVAKIWEYEGWTPADYPNDPMMNFDERDLVKHAESAGFREIHLDLVVDVEPGRWIVDWDRLLETSPNPNAHTAGEAIAGALTDEEASRFEAHLRPLADAGDGIKRDASAYLWAVR